MTEPLPWTIKIVDRVEPLWTASDFWLSVAPKLIAKSTVAWSKVDAG